MILSPVRCHDSLGSVTGGFVEPIVSGISKFTELLASCDPGYSMSVHLTCSVQGATLSAYFHIGFS